MRQWAYSTRTAWAAFAILYVLILVVSLDYGNGWVQQEAPHWKRGILKDGLHFSWKDLTRGFDFELFEREPRTTRPWSSYFEIVDTRFRAWLWNYIPPHPNLSLLYLVTLVFTPFFLYQLLGLLAFSPSLRIAGTAFFLASPGSLSTFVMLFRPAKALTSFCIVFTLWLAFRYKKNPKVDRFVPAILFLSFFVDETALLSYPALFLLNRGFVKRHVVFFVLAPFGYALTIHFGFPWLSAWFGYSVPQGHYDTEILTWAWSISGGLLRVLTDYFTNLKLLFKESLPLYNLQLLNNSLLFVIGIFSWLITVALIVKSIRKRKRIRDPLFFRLTVLLFVSSVVHSLLMVPPGHRVWGIFWYGTHWSLFFTLWLCALFRSIELKSSVVIAILFVFSLGNLAAFVPLNQTQKAMQTYGLRRLPMREIFLGGISRFDRHDLPASKELQALTRHLWTHPDTRSFPKELEYVHVEMGRH